MTVKELIEVLKLVNPDRIVILQKDSEGNGFSPLAGIDDNAVYQPYHHWSGEVKIQTLTDDLRRQGYEEKDTGEGAPCLVLFPVN